MAQTLYHQQGNKAKKSALGAQALMHDLAPGEALASPDQASSPARRSRLPTDDASSCMKADGGNSEGFAISKDDKSKVLPGNQLAVPGRHPNRRLRHTVNTVNAQAGSSSSTLPILRPRPSRLESIPEWEDSEGAHQAAEREGDNPTKADCDSGYRQWQREYANFMDEYRWYELDQRTQVLNLPCFDQMVGLEPLLSEFAYLTSQYWFLYLRDGEDEAVERKKDSVGTTLRREDVREPGGGIRAREEATEQDMLQRQGQKNKQKHEAVDSTVAAAISVVSDDEMKACDSSISEKSKKQGKGKEKERHPNRGLHIKDKGKTAGQVDDRGAHLTNYPSPAPNRAQSATIFEGFKTINTQLRHLGLTLFRIRDYHISHPNAQLILRRGLPLDSERGIRTCYAMPPGHYAVAQEYRYSSRLPPSLPTLNLPLQGWVPDPDDDDDRSIADRNLLADYGVLRDSLPQLIDGLRDALWEQLGQCSQALDLDLTRDYYSVCRLSTDSQDSKRPGWINPMADEPTSMTGALPATPGDPHSHDQPHQEQQAQQPAAVSPFLALLGRTASAISAARTSAELTLLSRLWRGGWVADATTRERFGQLRRRLDRRNAGGGGRRPGPCLYAAVVAEKARAMERAVMRQEARARGMMAQLGDAQEMRVLTLVDTQCREVLKWD